MQFQESVLAALVGLIAFAWGGAIAGENNAYILQESERLELVKALYPAADVSKNRYGQFVVKAAEELLVDMSHAYGIAIGDVEYKIAAIRFPEEEKRVRYAIKARKEWRRTNLSFFAIVSRGFDGPHVIKRTLAEKGEAYCGGHWLEVEDYLGLGRPQLRINYDSRRVAGGIEYVKVTTSLFDLPDGRTIGSFVLGTESTANPGVRDPKELQIVNVDGDGTSEVAIIHLKGGNPEVFRLQGGILKPWKDAPRPQAWPRPKRVMTPREERRTITLRGTVEDAEGNPLADAGVQIIGAKATAGTKRETRKSMLTDNKGEFLIEIECDQVTGYLAYKKGYVRKPVTFGKGGAVPLRPGESLKIVLEKEVK